MHSLQRYGLQLRSTGKACEGRTCSSAKRQLPVFEHPSAEPGHTLVHKGCAGVLPCLYRQHSLCNLDLPVLEFSCPGPSGSSFEQVILRILQVFLSDGRPYLCSGPDRSKRLFGSLRAPLACLRQRSGKLRSFMCSSSATFISFQHSFHYLPGNLTSGRLTRLRPIVQRTTVSQVIKGLRWDPAKT